MRTRDPYVLELAETVSRIFAEGNTDPSAEEIAKAHFPERALGGEIVDGIRKRLRRVRDILETDYDFPVCLLSHTYYVRYRKNPPKTESDARRCIPGGRAVTAAGIRMQTDGDADLIWQAMVSVNLASGAGKMKKSADRTLEAVADHRLDSPHAAALLNRAHQQAKPERTALASQVMKTLPKGKTIEN
jgi:hypothetical protein